MRKKLFVTLLTLSFLFLAVTPVLSAVNINYGLENVRSAVNWTQQDLPTVIGNIIKVVLGLLGLIALIIIVIAGFQWMTSGGNEEKVTGAKKLMSAGVIGLLIILIAYAAASFIVERLSGIS